MIWAEVLAWATRIAQQEAVQANKKAWGSWDSRFQLLALGPKHGSKLEACQVWLFSVLGLSN